MVIKIAEKCFLISSSQAKFFAIALLPLPGIPKITVAFSLPKSWFDFSNNLLFKLFVISGLSIKCFGCIPKLKGSVSELF